jgi:hypothetical protein
MTTLNTGDVTNQRRIIATVTLDRPLTHGERVRLLRNNVPVGPDQGLAHQTVLTFIDVITSQSGDDPIYDYVAKFIGYRDMLADSPIFTITFDDEIRCSVKVFNPNPTPSIIAVAVWSGPPAPAVVDTITDLGYLSAPQLVGDGGVVWFKLLLDFEVFVEFSSAQSQADTDTMMGLYDGLGNLLDVDDDGAGNLKSLIDFNAHAGADYYVALTRYPANFEQSGFVVTNHTDGPAMLRLSAVQG